jgi:hypothetical protein
MVERARRTRSCFHWDKWCKWRFHDELVFVGIRSAKVNSAVWSASPIPAAGKTRPPLNPGRFNPAAADVDPSMFGGLNHVCRLSGIGSQRFLDQHMFASLECCHGKRRMGVSGGRDRDGVGVSAAQLGREVRCGVPAWQGRQLDQKTAFTDADMQRIELLSLVELSSGEVALTGWRHTKVDKSVPQFIGAQATPGILHGPPFT